MTCLRRRLSVIAIPTVILGTGTLVPPAEAGSLYIAGTIGEVYQGDSQTGGFEQFGGICLGPVEELAMDDAHIYAGDLNGGVIRFDSTTGEYMGIYFVPDGVTSMAYDGNYLLTGAANGSIHRVRPATGEVIGTFQAFAPVEAMLISGDDLYVTGPEGSVWIGNSTTGDFEYFGCSCGGLTQGIAVDETHLYVGDSFGLLLSYDLTTGFLANEGSLPFAITSLVMDGDVLVISDDASNVHRVDPATYEVLATLASPISINTIVMEGIATPTCMGDTDGDGDVDVDDLNNVILDYGTDGTKNGGDANDSGLVNVDDLVAVIVNWGDC